MYLQAFLGTLCFLIYKKPKSCQRNSLCRNKLWLTTFYFYSLYTCFPGSCKMDLIFHFFEPMIGLRSIASWSQIYTAKSGQLESIHFKWFVRFEWIFARIQTEALTKANWVVSDTGLTKSLSDAETKPIHLWARREIQSCKLFSPSTYILYFT